MLSLNVFGRFLIVDPGGKDRTPKSAKARGLIALLAMSQGFSRNRAWLQDKLWSDRDAKRGADSLRQTLVEIRRVFGPYEVLKADREKVLLDAAHFSAIYNHPPETPDWNDELDAFSDLNVADSEFEDWIRNLRSALPDKVPRRRTSEIKAIPSAKPAIFLTILGDHRPASDVLGRHFATLVTATLLDLDDFQIFPHRESGQPVPSAGLSISIHVVTQPRRQSQVTLTVAHPQTHQLYWSRLFFIPLGSAETTLIHRECGALVQAVVSTLRERKNELGISNTPALLAAYARSQIFRFDRQSLNDADTHLQYAYNQQPRPQYLAWRAFLRNMAQFQHRSSAFLDDNITSNELMQEAMRQASGSASILGISAHLEYLGGESSRGSLSLAERAASIDPLNAVNFAILSNSELAFDRLTESRSSSLTALALSGSGEHRAFIEFFCCMSAAALCDYGAAIKHAEAALILRPSFLAPLRYLVVLYKQMGMSEELEGAIIRLRHLEPDFHPGLLLERDYPVTTMRRIRLIEAVGG